MKHLKKLSEELLHTNPWWNYKHDTYEKPNGETGDYYYAETNGMVKIVPIMPDGRIVLTLQHRYLTGKQSIEFPAGGIEQGEDIIEAVKRELMEEVGGVAQEIIKIGVFEPSNGFAIDTAHIFLAYVDEIHPNASEDTEEIEVLYRRVDEIERMVTTNEIWDGATLATWSLVRNHLKA